MVFAPMRWLWPIFRTLTKFPLAPSLKTVSHVRIGWVFQSKGMQMGQIIWITSAVAIVAAVVGAKTIAEQAPQSSIEYYDTAYVEPDIGEPEAFFITPSAGSALASAAFGLSALQPETYNEEIVLDIIDASPLKHIEKMRLTASLEAARAGQADLGSVLSDVRVSLAVD